VNKNGVIRKKVPSRGVDERSTAYIPPYWEYRRNIAYMNELGEIAHQSNEFR
jgi:hypothetical protein